MTKNRRNYYRILHVQPDAHAEVIRSSYRTLMQKLKMHPDLGGDHWNAALVNEAFHVLSDPQKRSEYDKDRELILRGIRDVETKTTRTESDGASPGRTGARPTQESATEQDQNSEPDPATQSESDSQSSFITESTCLFCLHPTQQHRHLDPLATCINCESPLHPAEPVSYEDSGQRKVARIKTNLTVRVFETWPQATGIVAVTQDLSPNGVRLATMHPISPRQRIKIVSDVFDAVAWVTNSRQVQIDDAPGWSVGIVFETLVFHRSKGSFVSLSA